MNVELIIIVLLNYVSKGKGKHNKGVTDLTDTNERTVKVLVFIFVFRVSVKGRVSIYCSDE